MNNYKFRGRTAEGKWVYGMPLEKFDGSIWIDTCKHFEEDGFTSQNVQEVLPETVGQDTMVKDIKLSPIFSGDILGVPNKKYMPWVVEFHDGIFWAVCRDVKVKYNPNSYGLDRQHLKDFVSTPSVHYISGGIEKEYFIVIGNIHDNPELLEGK